MKKITETNLYQLFSNLSKTQKVYIPVDEKGGAKFAEYTSGAKLTKEFNTLKSAKEFFFPQTEDIVDFKLSGKEIEIIESRSQVENFVVFGVRACDQKSFDILDSVFLADPVDTYYKNRREHGLIITLACFNPDSSCFCMAFGIDAVKPAGDIRAFQVENDYYFEPLTEKGANLINENLELFTEGDDLTVQKAVEVAKEKLANLPLANLTPQDFTKEQLEVFKSDEWKDLSKACLGCGTCTFVCPTCQCYDIKDFDTGNGVKRFRCWDSCMYKDFTMMAHGTPRPTQVERFRQRFMHKLVYYPANHQGVYGCVGCGRCVRKCPISMNIVKVMKRLGENKND